ncbi:MAG: hypothetical protein NUV82_03025 [Candidatus Komeilibacteria bacterium]|nr:hypothetical protein [Candidatus Komeilibacteria bacterium]
MSGRGNIVMVGVGILVGLMSMAVGVWNPVGFYLYPVLWFLIVIYFNSTESALWTYVAAAGLTSGWQKSDIVPEIIALMACVIFLQIVFRHWLVHRNLLSWLVAGIAVQMIYLLGRYLWQILMVDFGSSYWLTITWYSVIFFLLYNTLGIIIIYVIGRSLRARSEVNHLLKI